jgi:hypothetical protein
MNKNIIALGVLFLSNLVYAGVPSSFTYEGKVLNSAGTAPLTSVVSLTLSIYDPTGTCLLYQEQQANIDLSQTNGLFAVQVGSAIGAVKRTPSDQALGLSTLFANNGQILASGTTGCLAGYTPGTNDIRILRVQVTNGGSTVTISPDLQINAVPNAMVAETVQGLSPATLAPVGSILTTSISTCPPGYLAADGTLYSATTYSNLALAYKNSANYIYGGTVSSGNFNVPNTQGLFLRGSGLQVNGKTYSTTVGTVQTDSTAVNGMHDTGHTHSPSSAGQFEVYVGSGGNSSLPGGNTFLGNSFTSNGYAVLAGDAETRPANLGVKYCVKY